MDQKFAIVENGVVQNIASASFEFGESQGWVICSDSVEIGWLYQDEEFISQPPPDYSAENKATAMQLLTETDWTQMPDVNLSNKDEFAAYRAAVRAIAVNPPASIPDWPVIPTEVWA